MRYVDNYPIPGRHIVYNMDDDRDVAALQKEIVVPTRREVYPRDWDAKPLGSYGPPLSSRDALGSELTSLDNIVKPADLLDSIDESHARKLYPYYYAHEVGPFPDDEHIWDQNGLGYCWTWSFVAEFMVLRACLGMKTVLFAPVANGDRVGWANRGNWLGDMLTGARQNGITPIQGGEISLDEWPKVDINSHNNSRSFWQPFEKYRKDFKLGVSWELDCRSGEVNTACQLESALRAAIPQYMAHNYWSHALGIEALFRDERAPNGVTYGHRNSHKNKRLLILEGTKGTPDESHGLVSVQSGEVGEV